MYSDERKNKGSFIKELLIKLLLVVIFIFFIIWLFPTKSSLSPLFQSIFRDNLNSMKESASTYYTNERMPSEVGDSTKMTLQEMLDKKLILDFVDKNGNSCDTNNSYVEVTKMETEYELKVMLSCDGEEQYIIEHLGCTDKCGSCDTEQTALEYQFKKISRGKEIIGYSCPTDYKLSGNKCYKSSIKTVSEEAIKEYSDEQTLTKTAITNTTTTYSCPTGWTKDGTSCYRAATTTSNTTYYCPTGTPSGSNCYIGATASTSYSYTTLDSTTYYSNKVLLRTYVVQECDPGCSTIRHYVYQITNSTTTYSCPAGWTRDNTQCYKAMTPSTSTSYTCSVGTLSGSNCLRDATKSTNTTYSCSSYGSDWRLSNGKCYKTIGSELIGYSCSDSSWKLSGDKCYKNTTVTISEKAKAKYKTVKTTVYKWSRSTILRGWIATGKTRTITVAQEI